MIYCIKNLRGSIRKAVIVMNQKNSHTTKHYDLGEEKAKRFVSTVTWEDILRTMRDTYHSPRKLKHNIIVLKNPSLPNPEHTHTFFVIIYVLSGNGTHLINQHPERMQAGDLYLLPPKAGHALCGGNDCITIMIHPDAFKSIFSGLLQGQDCLGDFLRNSLYRNDSETYLLFHTGQNREMQDIMMQMLKIMANADDYTDRVLSGMILLLSTSLIRTHQDAVRTAPDNEKDSEIVSLIYEHYDTITLSALAEKLHYTVPYCSKYLKNHLGRNFSELLGKIRFQKAENFLVNSEMTIAEISRTLGYENPENFVRAFKSRYRMTPSQYRLTQAARAAELPPRLEFWGFRHSGILRTKFFLKFRLKTVWIFPFFPFII